MCCFKHKAQTLSCGKLLIVISLCYMGFFKYQGPFVCNLLRKLYTILSYSSVKSVQVATSLSNLPFSSQRVPLSESHVSCLNRTAVISYGTIHRTALLACFRYYKNKIKIQSRRVTSDDKVTMAHTSLEFKKGRRERERDRRDGGEERRLKDQ